MLKRPPSFPATRQQIEDYQRNRKWLYQNLPKGSFWVSREVGQEVVRIWLSDGPDQKSGKWFLGESFQEAAEATVAWVRTQEKNK